MAMHWAAVDVNKLKFQFDLADLPVPQLQMSRCRVRSLVDDSECSHRGARSTFKFQRNPKELELTLADQVFQVHEPLPMADLQVPA